MLDTHTQTHTCADDRPQSRITTLNVYYIFMFVQSHQSNLSHQITTLKLVTMETCHRNCKHEVRQRWEFYRWGRKKNVVEHIAREMHCGERSGVSGRSKYTLGQLRTGATSGLRTFCRDSRTQRHTYGKNSPSWCLAQPEHNLNWITLLSLQAPQCGR